MQGSSVVVTLGLDVAMFRETDNQICTEGKYIAPNLPSTKLANVFAKPWRAR
jgi:hypothetical protein